MTSDSLWGKKAVGKASVGRAGLQCQAGLWFFAGLLVATAAVAQTGANPPWHSGTNGGYSPAASAGFRVHDPSTVIKCKDEYWVFHTGRGIPSLHSKDLANWEPGPPVFTNAPPWVAAAVPARFGGQYFWAPDVIDFHGRYLLYYSASRFGTNTSAIGLASNPTLDPNDPACHWTDEGLVVQSVARDNFNAIDPSVFDDGQGGLWLVFGSFWSGIKLVELDPSTGKRAAPGSEPYSLAFNKQIEAPCIYKKGRYYYLFVNWGFCCRGTNSTYEIRMGRSDKPTGPYVDKDGKEMLSGGGTKFLGTEGSFIGPGHAGILKVGDRYWFSCHFYDATREGTPGLALRPMRWREDGWPELQGPPVLARTGENPAVRDGTTLKQ